MRSMAGQAFASLLLLTAVAGPAVAGLGQWTSQGPYEDGSEPAYIGVLEIDPTAAAVYARGRGKVYRSEDGGQSWQPVDLPVTDSELAALAADPTAAGSVYLVSVSGDLWKSTDGGASWTLVGAGLSGLGLIGRLLVDPFVPSTLYATSPQGALKSEDAGVSWTLVNDGLDDGGTPYVGTLVIDPQVPSRLYAGTNLGLFVSSDGGGSWMRLEIPTRRVPAVSLVAVDPQTPSTLYVPTFVSGQARLWKSTDGGATWSRIGLERGLRDLVIDPANSSILYAGTSKRVFRSTNGGATWSHFDDGLIFGGGLHDLALTGANPTTVFAATDGGVFDVRAATFPTVLDLRNGRFQVQVEWRDFENATGEGKVAFAGGDSGLFYFFDVDNWELLVKVLDGCAINDRFWVFGAATTNVGYTLRVTDTATGTVKTYHNPLGVASPAITDTQAFATCAAN